MSYSNEQHGIHPCRQAAFRKEELFIMNTSKWCNQTNEKQCASRTIPLRARTQARPLTPTFYVSHRFIQMTTNEFGSVVRQAVIARNKRTKVVRKRKSKLSVLILRLSTERLDSQRLACILFYTLASLIWAGRRRRFYAGVVLATSKETKHFKFKHHERGNTTGSRHQCFRCDMAIKKICIQ